MKRGPLLVMAGLASLVLAGVAAVCLTGCANIGYYVDSASGHLRLMNAARPVQEVVDDQQTRPALRERLRLAQRMREFAVRELHLPDNASYRRYADLGRAAAVWNVVAAPPHAIELKTWCFPVTGCVGYRGYYDEAAAQAEAAAVAAQGFEVQVYPVPAYSTLGWLNWAGGDPLLSTFIGYPEGELARLLFHELAHQVVYVQGDTMFNESFATAVERLGGAIWLQREASSEARAAYADFDGRRRQFRELARRTREQLAAHYAASAGDAAAREAGKQRILAAFRDDYARLRAGWTGDASRWRGYDAWVARANNAFFATQAAYDGLVPGFEAIFESVGRDWPRFYDAVRALARLPREERHRRLKESPGG